MFSQESSSSIQSSQSLDRIATARNTMKMQTHPQQTEEVSLEPACKPHRFCRFRPHPLHRCGHSPIFLGIIVVIVVTEGRFG